MSKRLREAAKLVDMSKFYQLEEALDVLSSYGHSFKAKFDETVEIVMKLGVDPKHSNQIVRGSVVMPNGLGKTVRVAVFTRSERINEAKEAGADIYGSEDLVEKVKGGFIDFDSCIATPDMMAKLSVLGKVLGPRGLMPNPKLGTVSDDIAEAVNRVKSGQVEYKVEKAGIIHAGVGKLSFNKDALQENIRALYISVLSAKPSAAKGIYMQKFFLSTSQGFSIPLDLSSVVS